MTNNRIEKAPYITVEVAIPEERLDHLISAGLQQIGYWGEVDDEKSTAMVTAIRLLPDSDYKGETLFRFSRATLPKALSKMAEANPHQFSKMLTDTTWDAETGEILIQFALFGEEPFG